MTVGKMKEQYACANITFFHKTDFSGEIDKNGV